MTCSTAYIALRRFLDRNIVAILVTFIVVVGAYIRSDPASAQTPTLIHTTSLPCDSPRHHEFDFWLGDWQVLDAKTGKLVAFDRVEKQVQGCAVTQNMVWLSDNTRLPQLNYRRSGISVSVVHGDEWSMLWVDTYGGSVSVEGQLQKDGSMIFQTSTPSGGSFIRGVWLRNTDGTVRNTGYSSNDGKNWIQTGFDYLYVPNR